MDYNKILFFDFDGVIANTEPYHTQARDAALAQFGVTIRDWSSYIGIRDEDIFMELKERFHLGMDVPAVVDRKLRLSKELVIQSGLQPNPVIEKYIKEFPNRKYVLTRQRKDFVDFFLNKWGLARYIEEVISLSYSHKTKAEAILDMVAPTEAILFEDVLRIIKEVQDKGIQCVFVDKDGSVYWDFKQFMD